LITGKVIPVIDVADFVCGDGRDKISNPCFLKMVFIVGDSILGTDGPSEVTGILVREIDCIKTNSLDFCIVMCLF
jgi:hypothetical protein